MKNTTIKAIFKGKSGCVGYLKDKEYLLLVTYKPDQMIEIKDANITTIGIGLCQYESILSFLKNWDNIRTVKQSPNRNKAFGKRPKCLSCRKNSCAEAHTCPYASDINNDNETLCNCCTECEYECERAI